MWYVKERWDKTQALESSSHRTDQIRRTVDWKASKQIKIKKARRWEGTCPDHEAQEDLNVYNKNGGQRIRQTVHDQKTPGMGQGKPLKQRPCEQIQELKSCTGPAQLLYSALTVVAAQLKWPRFELLPLMKLKPVDWVEYGRADSSLAKPPSDIK